MRVVHATYANISFQTYGMYGELRPGAYKAQLGLRRKGELVELLEAFAGCVQQVGPAGATGARL